MSRSINTKVINTRDLSGKCSVWEASWQLLHKYKNINGELIFSDSEINDYPIFQLNLARWLLKDKNCKNGTFPDNSDITIPAETSDLISIIARNKLKCHDPTSSTSFSSLKKVSFEKDESDDIKPPECSKGEDKSSKILINGSYLEKFTEFATGFTRGAKTGLSTELELQLKTCFTMPPGVIYFSCCIFGAINELNDEDDSLAMHLSCCQRIIDEADRKAKSGEQLTEDELDALVFIYKLIPIGGRLYGYKEAAKLMDLYLKPKEAAKYTEEAPYKIKSEVYTTSKIVQYAESELKKIIADDFRDGNVSVGKRYDSRILKPTNRDSGTEGNVQSNGNLIVEQNNQRLKNTDHRFLLQVKILEISGNDIKLLWYVLSLWDFDPYEKADHITELPINKKKEYVLRIPDGLSQYLTKVDRAAEFHYTAEWQEGICIKD
ncbi:MAG: hypothetical protein J6C11_01715 [Spirochaetaceae bacterium]|nr:hypothetical protein [Spirochaetaceae bacterium]MBQ7366652.1 hypothetical protein [Spirochaetaceae bacterium]